MTWVGILLAVYSGGVPVPCIECIDDRTVPHSGFAAAQDDKLWFPLCSSVPSVVKSLTE